MKTSFLSLSCLCLICVRVAAEPAVAESSKLPYGVGDVLKLSKAQVNENVIITYIQNSGTVYNLEAKDIVYLREQGVSDAVLTAMLNQRREVAQVASQQAPATQAPAAPQTVAPSVPQPVYQDAASYTPASSLYVIPYPTYSYPVYYSSYSYYPYYSSYCYPYRSYGYPYGYCGPSFSFRFGGGGGFRAYGSRGFSHVGSFGGHFGGGHIGGGGHFGGGFHASGGGGHHR